MRIFLNKILSKFGYCIVNTNPLVKILPDVKYGKIDEYVSKIEISRDDYIYMQYRDAEYINKLEKQCSDKLLDDIRKNIVTKSYADLTDSNYIIESRITTINKQ